MEVLASVALWYHDDMESSNMLPPNSPPKQPRVGIVPGTLILLGGALGAIAGAMVFLSSTVPDDCIEFEAIFCGLFEGWLLLLGLVLVPAALFIIRKHLFVLCLANVALLAAIGVLVIRDRQHTARFEKAKAERTQQYNEMNTRKCQDADSFSQWEACIQSKQWSFSLSECQRQTTLPFQSDPSEAIAVCERFSK